MAETAARPRGTEDVLPAEAAEWRRLEAIARDWASRYGFGELRTPSFESTALIHRVGESTDIVQKETYDLIDPGGRAVTLRPEGTAPVVRACLQAGLLERDLPLRVSYVGMSAFRYERPESGRLRQHHQFGCECFGAAGPAADAELILLLGDFLAAAGIAGAAAHLNTIGCPACRPAYRAALQAYYRERLPTLCADCRRRFDQNPLRLLDCKVDREAAGGAPHALDHACPGCREHFLTLESLLAAAGLVGTVDHLLVRGFDYYTRTVFEFVHAGTGGEVVLGGGGRYDDLVASLGGPPLPAAGFGLGLERLLGALAAQGRREPATPGCDLFVTGADPTAVFALCAEARRAGLAAEFDPLGRSLKAQFRLADRLGARHVAILQGAERPVALRDMRTRAQVEVPAWGVVAAVRRGG